MQAILTQEKCIETLKGESLMLAQLTKTETIVMVDKARSSIILCVRDKVLSEVIKEETAI